LWQEGHTAFATEAEAEVEVSHFYILAAVYCLAIDIEILVSHVFSEVRNIVCYPQRFL
jgi:prolyl-tRNA synthetase